MKCIDLSHTFTDNMPVFPGDPATSLKQITTIQKNGYTDHSLTTVMHVGTHMDAPIHMIEGGKYIDELPLTSFSGPGVCINVCKKPVIDADVLAGVKIPPRSIVLLYTGMSDVYGSPAYDTGYPRITPEFARELVRRNIRMVGMDMINPDTDEMFPIHKILLSEEILIMENLTNLISIVRVPSFDIFAYPVKLHADAAPVRAIACFGSDA